MPKGLATAVLWAITSLLSTADLNDDGIIDMDDAEDGIVDLVNSGQAASHHPHSPLLTAASIACGQRIDHAWLIGGRSHPIGAVAIHTSGNIAHLNLAVQSPDKSPLAIASTLLPRALKECRELGVLKVLIEPGELDNEALSALVQPCGFHFSRVRELNGNQACEFYLDLYWRGESSQVTPA